MIVAVANNIHVGETAEEENTVQKQNEKTGMSPSYNLSSTLSDGQEAGQNALAKSTAALNVVLDGKKRQQQQEEDDENIVTRMSTKVAEVVQVSRRRRRNRRWDASMDQQNPNQQDISSTGVTAGSSNKFLPRKCKSLGDEVLVRNSTQASKNTHMDHQQQEEGTSEVRTAIDRRRSFEARAAAAFTTTTTGKSWNWKDEAKVTSSSAMTPRKAQHSRGGLHPGQSSPKQLVAFEKCTPMKAGSSKRASVSEALEEHKREVLERKSKKDSMRRAMSHDPSLVPTVPTSLSPSSLDEDQHSANRRTSDDPSAALDKSSRRRKLSSLAMAMAKSHGETQGARGGFGKSQNDPIPALTASTSSSSLGRSKHTTSRAPESVAAPDKSKSDKRTKLSSLALAMAKSHSEHQGSAANNKDAMDVGGNSGNHSITLMDAAKAKALRNRIISVEDIRRASSKNKKASNKHPKSSSYDDKRDKDNGLDKVFSNRGSVTTSSPISRSSDGMPRRTSSKGSTNKTATGQSSPTKADAETSARKRNGRRASMNDTLDSSLRIPGSSRRSSTSSIGHRRVKGGGRKRLGNQDLSVSVSDHGVLQSRSTNHVHHSERINSTRRSQPVDVSPTMNHTAYGFAGRRLPNDSSSSSNMDNDGSLDVSSSSNYAATTPCNHGMENEQDERTARGIKMESTRRSSSSTEGDGSDQPSWSFESLTAVVKQSSPHHHRRCRRCPSATRRRSSSGRGGGSGDSMSASMSSTSVRRSRSTPSSSVSGFQLQQVVKQHHQEEGQPSMPNRLKREGRGGSTSEGNQESCGSTRESSASIRQPEVNKSKSVRKLEKLERRSKHGISRGLNDSIQSGLSLDEPISRSSLSSRSGSIGGKSDGVVVLPLVSGPGCARRSSLSSIAPSATTGSKDVKSLSLHCRTSLSTSKVLDNPLHVGRSRLFDDLDSDSEDELLGTSLSDTPMIDLSSAVAA